MVVTDLREPLIDVHRRIMRRRGVFLLVWLAGWIVAGVLWRDGWLATGILLGSGPGLWLIVAALFPHRPDGRRVPVTRRALPRGRG